MNQGVSTRGATSNSSRVGVPSKRCQITMLGTKRCQIAVLGIQARSIRLALLGMRHSRIAVLDMWARSIRLAIVGLLWLVALCRVWDLGCSTLCWSFLIIFLSSTPSGTVRSCSLGSPRFRWHGFDVACLECWLVEDVAWLTETQLGVMSDSSSP
jgi:hypothetical protein